MSKRMSEDVRTFSTIGNLILRTSLFSTIVDATPSPPPPPPSRTPWRVLAVKSGATLSPNPLFHEKVLKSLQFLKVTATLTGYLQQLRARTRPDGRAPGGPALLPTPPEPLQASCLGN